MMSLEEVHIWTDGTGKHYFQEKPFIRDIGIEIPTTTNPISAYIIRIAPEIADPGMFFRFWPPGEGERPTWRIIMYGSSTLGVTYITTHENGDRIDFSVFCNPRDLWAGYNISSGRAKRKSRAKPEPAPKNLWQRLEEDDPGMLPPVYREGRTMAKRKAPRLADILEQVLVMMTRLMPWSEMVIEHEEKKMYLRSRTTKYTVSLRTWSGFDIEIEPELRNNSDTSRERVVMMIAQAIMVREINRTSHLAMSMIFEELNGGPALTAQETSQLLGLVPPP